MDYFWSPKRNSLILNQEFFGKKLDPDKSLIINHLRQPDLT
jgi:hypothetical protein